MNTSNWGANLRFRGQSKVKVAENKHISGSIYVK